jgi:hypothetical protein
MTSGDKVLFEVSDFYEKQTYRNRLYIQSANAKQMLSVQVKHTHTDGKQLYKDVLVSNDFDWQKLHWRSLETAYRTSPYFEFYEDDLLPVFEKKYKYLVDLNLDTIQIINDLLEIDLSFELTETFQKDYEPTEDLRYLKNAKKELDIVQKMPVYTQMFNDRHPFMPNLSILDLLFMEGPNATTYLEQVNEMWSKKTPENAS